MDHNWSTIGGIPEEYAMDTNETVKKQESQSQILLINEIGYHIFEEYTRNLTSSDEKSPPFTDIWNSIQKDLAIKSAVAKSSCEWSSKHRIGPPSVKFNFNRKKFVGRFDFKDSDLEICSKDNFSTIYANTCVFKGKWQYELMLGSKGVMQVGWATLGCEFSQENGVGDTPDSYAYDGNRQRKWNVATHKYGELWNCGDIISCTIDLDKGEISYLRNGRSLGIAFEDVKVGPGIAYFPAFSLAIDEVLLANFGDTPFAFPQQGFLPLQAPPVQSTVLAESCMLWLTRLVKLAASWDPPNCDPVAGRSRRVASLIVADRLGTLLEPVLPIPYVIENELIPILEQFAISIYDQSVPEAHHAQTLKQIHLFFNYILAILQEEEQKQVMCNLVMCLQRRYRQTSHSIDYKKQKASLRLLSFVLSDPTVRKFCLSHVLFEKERFLSFVSIKSIDKIYFKNFANIDFWSSKNGKFFNGKREHFKATVAAVETSVKELEELQIGILKLLMTSDDATSFAETSRAIFLSKLRQFIKEQLIGSRLSAAACIPSSVILFLFHSCLLLFLRLWEEEMEGEELGETSIPPSIFYDGVVDYFDSQRLGGLESHLKKKYAMEREVALKEKEFKQLLNPIESSGKHCSNSLSAVEKNLPSTSGAVLGELLTEVESVNEGMQRVNVRGAEPNKENKRSKEELRTSLLHLLDGVVLLYHHGGHKQLEKIVAQSDVLFDNVAYLEELIKKKQKYLEEQENSSHLVLNELNRSISVLEYKLKEQSYQHAWNLATILSVDNVKRFQILLKLILGSLKGSSKQLWLFTFVPDFYVEALTELCQDLRHLILCNHEQGEEGAELKLYQPGGHEIPSQISHAYQQLLMNVGEFLALHFCDSRIIYADSKDSLVQALAGFVCHRPGLEALQRMPLESRVEMVKSLLQPYENRAWAQNNWILVRFWKGKGFAFRFTRSPHLANKLGPKPAHCEIPNIILSSAPFFSEVFLGHVSDALRSTEISSPFLNSLLNQLNWVFSEFIGMLQEIQNASNRPERVFIDSRQLRICATCFDLALALLRVLEMIVSVSPFVFLDPERQDSKLLLTRLSQLLCQVLNRVSISTGCFGHVVNLEIPGLETIHYYPILTAVTGIIFELLKRDIYSPGYGTSDHSATKILLEEPSFQMSALYPLLGDKTTLKRRPSSKDASTSLRSSSSPLSLPSGDPLTAKLRIEPTDSNTSSVDNLFVSTSCECRHPKFCLRRYPSDVLKYELRKVVDVIHHLEECSALQMSLQKAEDSDSLCTICYANHSNAVFVPCGHTSCSTCITHYLMNKSLCFFCNIVITEVKESVGGKIIFTASAPRD